MNIVEIKGAFDNSRETLQRAGWRKESRVRDPIRKLISLDDVIALITDSCGEDANLGGDGAADLT